MSNTIRFKLPKRNPLVAAVMRKDVIKHKSKKKEAWDKESRAQMKEYFRG